MPFRLHGSAVFHCAWGPTSFNAPGPHPRRWLKAPTRCASLALFSLRGAPPPRGSRLPLGTAAGASLLSTIALVGVFAAEQQPTFRSRVELVTIDASVVDGRGAPLDDLTSDEFMLKVDGAARRIVSAQFIPQDAFGGTRRAGDLVSRYFTSNEHAEVGKLIVLAVDQANIRSGEGRRALQAASTFIDRLPPVDLVGVASIPFASDFVTFSTNRRAVGQELEQMVGKAVEPQGMYGIGLTEALAIRTGSRARLEYVVKRECGQPLLTEPNTRRLADVTDPDAPADPCPKEVEIEARSMAEHARIQSRMSLAALRSLIARLKEIEGPKTVVLLSEGFVPDDNFSDIIELGKVAQSARVTMYVLQLEVPVFEAAERRSSPTMGEDRQIRQDGLGTLAGAARGALFPLNGNDSTPFDRISRELSGYYLLAFEPRERDRDGRVHRIDLSVRRRGATVRSRRVFTVATDPTPTRSIESQLVDLLRGSRPATELPLRVTTYTYGRHDAPKLRLVVSAEADLTRQAGSDAGLGFVLVNEQSVVAASGQQRTTGGRYLFSAIVDPGRYNLRVAGIDWTGRRGSVERWIDVGLVESRGLRFSDVMLATDPPGAPTPRDGKDAGSRNSVKAATEQLSAVVERVIGEQVIAYLEIYAVEATALSEAHVRFEITRDAGEDPIVAREASLERRDARWSVAHALLPVKSLEPGTYVARAVVSSGGQPVTRINRPFRR